MPQTKFKSGPHKLKELEELTSMQRTFIAEYMTNGHNSTEAYLSAGYRVSPRRAIVNREAFDVRHNPNIEYNINKLMRAEWQSVQMHEDEALARTSEIARMDLGKYLYEIPAHCPHCKGELEEIGLVAIDLDQMKKDGATHLIKKVTPSRYGNIYDFYDSTEARRDMLKVHDAFSTKADKDMGGFASAMSNFLASKTNDVKQIEE